MFSKKRKIKPKAIINVNVETEWMDIDFPNKFHVMQTAISSQQNSLKFQCLQINLLILTNTINSLSYLLEIFQCSLVEKPHMLIHIDWCAQSCIFYLHPV